MSILDIRSCNSAQEALCLTISGNPYVVGAAATITLIAANKIATSIYDNTIGRAVNWWNGSNKQPKTFNIEQNTSVNVNTQALNASVPIAPPPPPSQPYKPASKKPQAASPSKGSGLDIQAILAAGKAFQARRKAQASQ